MSATELCAVREQGLAADLLLPFILLIMFRKQTAVSAVMDNRGVIG